MAQLRLKRGPPNDSSNSEEAAAGDSAGLLRSAAVRHRTIKVSNRPLVSTQAVGRPGVTVDETLRTPPEPHRARPTLRRSGREYTFWVARSRTRLSGRHVKSPKESAGCATTRPSFSDRTFLAAASEGLAPEPSPQASTGSIRYEEQTKGLCLSQLPLKDQPPGTRQRAARLGSMPTSFRTSRDWQRTPPTVSVCSRASRAATNLRVPFASTVLRERLSRTQT